MLAAILQIVRGIPVVSRWAYFQGRFVHPYELYRESASHAIEYVLSRKAVRQFVDAEIANQQLMDQGIVMVNALRIELNLQLVEYDPRREGRSWLGRGLVPFSGSSAYLFLPDPSPKCRLRLRQSDSLSWTIEQGMRIEPGVSPTSRCLMPATYEQVLHT